MKNVYLLATAAAAATAVAITHEISATTFLKEEFNDVDGFKKNWIVSSKWKPESDMGVWDLSPGEWYGDAKINQGMRTTQNAKFYGISTKLETPFSNRGKDLVVQFSVKHEKKQTSFCGGAYIKLLSKDTDQASFGGETPYYIMFGPDLCGYDVSRVHLIFNDKGTNLLKKDEIKLDYSDKDEFTHVYTLVVKPDNTYTVYIDMKEKSTGALHDGWAFAPKTLDDPTDKKPADWVDEKKIPDPEDKKPAGYDDIPSQIVDPEAKKPDDWDEEEDGKWEAPMIPNPEFKGTWKQKMIDNPAYKGEWKAKQIPNPAYRDDVYAFDDIGVVGYELWVVDSGSIFDNIYVGDSLDEATELAKATYSATIEAEKKAKKEKDDAEKAKAEAEKPSEAEATKATEPEDDEDAEVEDDEDDKDEL